MISLFIGILFLLSHCTCGFSYKIIWDQNGPNNNGTTREGAKQVEEIVECGEEKRIGENGGGRYKRIIGGRTARFGEFPWQAHIQIGRSQCGGALVNHHYVITAAHCVRQAELRDITVSLGEYDRKDTGEWIESLPKAVFTVIHKELHPRFLYKPHQPFRFDIAVLKLDRRVVYKDNISPVCLPPSPSEETKESVTVSLNGKHGHGEGVVAGWGKMDNSVGKSRTNVLQRATLPILSLTDNRECRNWYAKKNISVQLHFEMFCAGYQNGRMDTCGGDSGSPLVVFNEGRWMVVGITSSGFGCGLDHQPGIYHKVSESIEWLHAHIK